MRASGVRWAVLAWVMFVCVGAGCARKDDTETQVKNTEPPPTVPTPVTELPKNPVTAPDKAEIPSQMSTCAQNWDPSALWGYLYNSYSYGGYQPFYYDDASLPGYRGLRQRGARGLGCANSLMQWASMLNQYSGYYQPGALQSYLWQLLSWGYRNPYYYQESPGGYAY